MKKSTYKCYENLPLFLNTAKALGVSPSSGYVPIHKPGFPILKIGIGMVMPKEQFILWVANHTGGDS